jgi:hypothetical protein
MAKNASKSDQMRIFLIRMHDPKVNTAARQLRIFTATKFALLMDLNRASSGFPRFSAPEPALPQRRRPDA